MYKSTNPYAFGMIDVFTDLVSYVYYNFSSDDNSFLLNQSNDNRDPSIQSKFLQKHPCVIFIWHIPGSLSNILLVIFNGKILSLDNNGMEISMESFNAFIKYQLVGDQNSVLGLPEASGPVPKLYLVIVPNNFTEYLRCVKRCF